MTPAEIWHRARVTARDRLLPPAYAGWTPAVACARLFKTPAAQTLSSSRLTGLLRAPLRREQFGRDLEAAAELLQGRWRVFGREVRLEDPPRWNVHPFTGDAWPDLPSRRLDYRRADHAGGARALWEIGRLTALPALAAAWRATGERAYADRAVRWLDDWCERNPLDHGIHHTSGLEMANRVHTVLWTLALLGDRARDLKLEPCLGLVAQEALHCRNHLSLGSSANNHLIAEYAAMTTAGALLPTLRGADALLEAGWAGLEREVVRQFHPDGVNAEQAFGYLPFIWELVLCPLVAAAAAGREASAAVRQRLAASLEFARAIRLPGGAFPQIGDEDDGRLLLAGECGSRFDRVGNALAAWLGRDGLGGEDTALATLLAGRSTPSRAAADGLYEFPDGGYTVWRRAGLVVTFDHGPLGLAPLAAHGHADALSITVQRGADALAIDPGTFAYHEDPAARDRCRSTPHHNTVHFAGRSQSEMRGPFLWGAQATVRAHEGGYLCRWIGGETHHRRVEVGADSVTVHDRVEGAGATLVFVLSPQARVELAGTRAVAVVGGTRAVFETSASAPWRIEPGDHAPRFGARRPTPRLVTDLTAASCTTRIALADA